MLDVQSEADTHKGALFPRVHVSETRVPGPRAPPRNKMALFEQFTIPHHGFVPSLAQENSHKVDSSRGSGFVKLKQVKLGQRSSKGSDVSRGKAICEASKCSVAELCSYSEISKSLAACDSGEKGCRSMPSKHASEHMKKLWNRSTAESASVYYANGWHSPTDIRTQQSTDESRPCSSSTERMASLPYGCTEIEVCDTDKVHVLVGAFAENHSNNSAGVVSHGNCIATTELLVVSAASSGRFAGISETREANIVKTLLPVETIADESIHHECNGANDTNTLVAQMVCSDRSFVVAGDVGQQEHDVDKCNSDFLARIVPQHVIAVIGQREFWEARKTMLQQQKTLSMQVFELHRLIEVQRLIAAMPGLLLEEKGKCYIVNGSTQPELAKVSPKLVTEESLNEGKHRSKQKQSVGKGLKKLTKLPSGVSNTTVNDTCQNFSLQVLPLKPASLDHTWGFIPTQFVKNPWLNAGSQNYGFCRGPMACQSPILGHWYNGQQALQSVSCNYMFPDWSRPCNFIPKDIREGYIPPLASQRLVNGNLIHQLDRAQAGESIWIANLTTSVLRKPSYFTSNSSASAHHNKPINNSQQKASTIERQRSSDCNKLASHSTEFTGDVYVSDKTKPLSLGGSCELRNERRNILGFQSQPAKGEVATAKVIRAVPHPASAAVQAAAKILKSIQQSE